MCYYRKTNKISRAEKAYIYNNIYMQEMYAVLF